MPKEAAQSRPVLPFTSVESAHGTIEGYCAQSGGRPGWFNTKSVSGRLEKQDLARAVEYLELRGMLKRRPSNGDWVRCERA